LEVQVYERVKPDASMYNSVEALAELRHRQADFSKDQLKRCSLAVLPGRPGGEGFPRFYTARDLDLLLVAHRLQMATGMRYHHLVLLVRFARSEGRDEIACFQSLLDQATTSQSGLSEQLTA
jgi:hypothetical protein